MCLGIPGRVVALVEGYGNQLAGGCRGRIAAGQRRPARRGKCGTRRLGADPHGFALERINEETAAQARQGPELMGRGVDQQ